MPETLRELPIDQLLVDPMQPRKVFDPDAIERLAASITARGVLMPLRVLWNEERQCYLIACGESRYRAAQRAKLTTLPCLVIDGEPSETDLLADRIVENHCRTDLNALEFANAISRLKRLKGCSSSALATELGLSNATISRAEALLTLPEEIQGKVGKGLSESAAYAISRLETPEQQFELAEKAVAGGWSRTVVEEAVQSKVPKKKTPSSAAKLALKLTGGIAVNFSAEKKLSWTDILTALERMQAAAKQLAESNKPPGDWAKALKTG